ncbi:oligoendopeptidase F [Clostridium tagluense]|uniref:oligoendopeptidase F n=1 Tax=Clostridium tagluense TaxID=360422 RepID=UPI001CF21D78|nr:oligoendopeptidase F [Clostridium tagluense]MCB2312889.1 oligoendopeptidase F [Clostridium tagluense]MCB2317655.1 oligoendopeptidase F [Clostridium tagluense]MCB2322388.1 oligoendopeptidase F [Clostridium tagluense]MCB2327391.1 oligoendopeptidase F [Clostridium tagluense]MCB2332157.1 oligoendopeptidase F [Clostridium tagluense]
MKTALKERKDVDKSLTWDLSSMYQTEEQYNLAIKGLEELTLEIEKNYKEKLNSANMINECLDKMRVVLQNENLVGSYANLAVSTDQTNIENQARYMKFINISSDLESRLSFVTSEIKEANEKIIDEAIEKSKENSHYLNEIKRLTKHSLHPEVEKVLSALSGSLDSPYSIYETTKLADMDFKNFNVDGIEYPLSFVLFENEWEYETNTKIRRAAFEAFSSKLGEYQHTVAALYQTHVQKEKTLATLRGFDSVIDSLLFPQQIERELYDRQIDIIMEKLAPHMRKYAKLLQKIHKIDEMTFADLKLEVDPAFEPTISVEESKKYVEGALSVLGDDYLEMVKKGYDERWIDFAVNKGKSTGAFCATPYGNHPFILISWSEKMREAFVLAHELGHAGHFQLINENQNIFDAEPSLYFIEAPSTMNELLMANYLMKTNDEPRFKRWVLSSIISRTYYHNFVTHLLEAAYQREVYKIIDAGESVQASTLNEIKKGVLEKFWGDSVKIVDGAELTWMRQPHYYMGLYPYTYSAGLTIATEVSNRILKEGQPAVDDWRKVLKAGGTKSPVELAKMAGVDITTEKPLLDTIEHIGDIIDQLVKLTDDMEGCI